MYMNYLTNIIEINTDLIQLKYVSRLQMTTGLTVISVKDKGEDLRPNS